MTTALIYNNMPCDETYLIAVEDGRWTSADLISKHHADADCILTALGLSHWSADNLHAVSYYPHTSVDAGATIPDVYAVVRTPSGFRQVSVPDIGDVWSAIRLRDEYLYNSLTSEDLIEVTAHNPRLQECQSDDLDYIEYSILMGHSLDDASWIGSYPTLRDAKTHATDICIRRRTEGIRVYVSRDHMSPGGLMDRTVLECNGHAAEGEML